MNEVRTVHSIEILESRRLLAAGPSLHHGLLKIQGDNKVENVVLVQLDADNAAKLNVIFNGHTTSYNVADVTRIRLQGGKKNDFMEISELNGDISIPASLQGNQGDDTLIGGSGNDTLKGLAGRDELIGNDGNDKFDGGVDDDMISGSDGDDNIKGGNGNDRIYGGSGNDTIDGGAGNDSVDGGEGVDRISARSGSDDIFSGPGADTVYLGKKAHYTNDPEDILK